MKWLLFAFVIGKAFAAPLDTIVCKSKVLELAQEWKSLNQWSTQYQGGLENQFLASPTPVVGEWVLIREIPNGTVIAKVGQGGRIETTFQGKNCSKDVKTYPHPAPQPGMVTDKDIGAFVKDKKTGAIYIWSPRMILSQKGIPEITKAAAALKLPLLVLLDKDVPAKEVKQLRKVLGPVAVKQVDSLELRMREIGQHFPALIVFKDSKILSEVKYGFEKSDRYQSDLTRMLGRSK